LEAVIVLGGLTIGASIVSAIISSYYVDNKYQLSDSSYRNWTLATVGAEVLATGFASAFCYVVFPLVFS
jgi:hypothetical protein